MGENLGSETTAPLLDDSIRRANRIFGDSRNVNSYMNFGEELGDRHVNDVRVWYSSVPGMIKVFARERADDMKEHKVVSSVLTAGVIMGGIALQYKKKH